MRVQRPWHPVLSFCGYVGLCLTGACLDTAPPGETLGVFDVEAVLRENTCGQMAIPVADRRFAVELVQDRESVYWRVLGGQRLVGRETEPGTLRIALQLTRRLYGPEPTAGVQEPLDFTTLDPEREEPRGCALLQSEILSARFGSSLTSPLIRDGGAPHDAEVQSQDTSAEPLPAFEGEHALNFAPTADSNCGAALLARGGIFEQLPCDVRFELRGYARP